MESKENTKQMVLATRVNGRQSQQQVKIKLATGDKDLPADEATNVKPETQTQMFTMKDKNFIETLEASIGFVKMMFTNPMRLGKRTMRFTQAEAKVLGKMAKVWYMKKKIKKFGKKLKKKTIAVPVITAIPIYEHSHYPHHMSHHVGHDSHMYHAASSYTPTMLALASNDPSQQMSASASHTYPRVMPSYRMGPHRIINGYQPSPPVFVDDTAGLYGHYGNAYGRYDGGYHIW